MQEEYNQNQCCEQDEQQKQEEIRELGSTRPKKDIQIVSIIGQIEGHNLLGPQTKATKYEHIIPLLTDAEQDDAVKGILLILNTAGGDVEAGLALAELVRGMRKPSVSLVLGGGHSIGVPMAVSADYSFIAPTASMTVHPLRSNGLFITSQESFAYFLKMQERIINFIADNAKIEAKQVQTLMNNKNQLVDDIGTVLTGKEAVQAGIIDAVGGLGDALEKLKNMQK